MASRILLIDDDPILSRTTAYMLGQAGFQVQCAQDARELSAILSDNPPNLIVLDYFLREENGATIAKRLKTQKETKNIPIIMISSSYGVESLARRAGVDLFLPKPFEIDTLIMHIHKLIL